MVVRRTFAWLPDRSRLRLLGRVRQAGGAGAVQAAHSDYLSIRLDDTAYGRLSITPGENGASVVTAWVGDRNHRAIEPTEKAGRFLREAESLIEALLTDLIDAGVITEEDNGRAEGVSRQQSVQIPRSEVLRTKRPVETKLKPVLKLLRFVCEVHDRVEDRVALIEDMNKRRMDAALDAIRTLPEERQQQLRPLLPRQGSDGDTLRRYLNELGRQIENGVFDIASDPKDL